MRFPLRLTADLALGLASGTLRGAPSRRLILHLSPVAHSAAQWRVRANSSPPNFSDLRLLSTDDCLDAVHRSSAPVVWIGGPEPLLHPEIGRLARRVVDAGRHVFVQTKGASLHRRIHEFRPVSRLFLTVQFAGFEQSCDRRVRREGEFRDALDGIRSAKLSGFLVCALITLQADAELTELERLCAILSARDVDGFLVVSATASSATVGAPDQAHALHSKLLAARQKIQSRRWQLFSSLLQSSLRSAALGLPTNRELSYAPASAADTCEESAPVS